VVRQKDGLESAWRGNGNSAGGGNTKWQEEAGERRDGGGQDVVGTSEGSWLPTITDAK